MPNPSPVDIPPLHCIVTSAALCGSHICTPVIYNTVVCNSRFKYANEAPSLTNSRDDSENLKILKSIRDPLYALGSVQYPSKMRKQG